MICLSDNDIIHKFAACDLVPEALAVLEVGWDDIRVLPTAKHKFGLTKKTAKAEARYGTDVFARIKEFIDHVREVDVAPLPEDLRVLSETDGIDSGEAILFATTARVEDAILATGDKRSLRALAGSPACLDIANRIAGRVICFEQIMRRIIGTYGFAWVKQKVVPNVDCDTVLRAVFGSGAETVESNVVVGLESYIAEIRGLPVALLV